ncbi:MAG: hypothetical protein PHT54_04490 [Candidatus Nanoarchaeia archaeon]|nr:hypothetical protein [Candidatus Nanoarchaeia archaeon]
MGKNSQIHLFLESNLLEALKQEASERKVTISELCRQKLREASQLTRIEILLSKLDKKLAKEVKK